METIKRPHLTRQPCRLTLLLAVGMVLASGCAQIPRLDPPPAMTKIADFGSSNSFAASVTAWPGDQWWRASRPRRRRFRVPAPRVYLR